ncbi:unnamed protein product [Pieris brassicae]|uniref:HTH psq-type domain-containing protein n=1 Tax=Pieris brassicae TaxID=7116 RepID=A0A9P0TG22_PIEBR|nr:unnamed protein product [Pieris brassicae]
MKVYAAAKHFNMPRRTLMRYLRENKQTKSALGRKPLSRIANEDVMIRRDWLGGFLKRHSNNSRRKAQMNQTRAQKLNKTVVTDYFNKLKKIMQDNDVMNKPKRIFNIDEKGCRLTTKRVYLAAPDHGENVTVVSCIRPGYSSYGFI